ncbi:Predicted membrane protein [Delftia tsuruhatensis]|nr:Predicted membrane protein [Delftia tsuruhatensis]CAC9676016.1 Predicted membrane protein [Delftia tsuruhatensis]
MFLDSMRGLALVWMTVFHFCFDLSHLGFWSQDFYGDPLWTWQRRGIVTLFLLCVGLAQAQVQARAAPAALPWRRWARLAACALAVSGASYAMFPDRYIYFGVLHCIALLSLALWWMRRWPDTGLLAAAILALAVPPLYQALAASWPDPLVRMLNGRAGSVLGLVTELPSTEDYVPLLPWLGVAVLGLWAGRQLARPGLAAPALPQHTARRPLRLLAWLGRHSLPYYMLHQLVLMGGLMALRAWMFA